MEKKIRISTGELKVEAELNDSKTAQVIWDALPIESNNNLWGEEIYFSIPVKAGQEKGAREVVSAGELGYWPPGHAFCIFFGPTPISKSGEIRPAGKVNVFGRIKGAPEVLKKASSHERIRVERS